MSCLHLNCLNLNLNAYQKLNPSRGWRLQNVDDSTKVFTTGYNISWPDSLEVSLKTKAHANVENVDISTPVANLRSVITKTGCTGQPSANSSDNKTLLSPKLPACNCYVLQIRSHRRLKPLYKQPLKFLTKQVSRFWRQKQESGTLLLSSTLIATWETCRVHKEAHLYSRV